MKTNKTIQNPESSRLRCASPRQGVQSQPAAATPLFRPRLSTLDPRRAFTLIELLVVMAVIGALAAMLLAVVGGVKKKQYVNNAQSEMAQLETALERYKAVYGVYPPSPTPPPTAGSPVTLINQLYFELEGTVLTNNNYVTLDNSSMIPASQVPTAFPGVGGFVNCTKPGSGEDSPPARDFLPDLRSKQVYTGFTNINTGVQGINLLVCSVGGPDATYQPVGLQGLNPWRYNSSSPTNNPGAYDLWVQLVIGGKTNLICNWSRQVQVNSPLP